MGKFLNRIVVVVVTLTILLMGVFVWHLESAPLERASITWLVYYGLMDGLQWETGTECDAAERGRRADCYMYPSETHWGTPQWDYNHYDGRV